MPVRFHRLLWFAAVTNLLALPLPAEELLPADQPVETVIDHYIRAGWGTVKPAPPADDATLIRRTTLDLAGRIPTALELREYLATQDAGKRLRLVETLLADPGYAYHQANELDLMLLLPLRREDKFREYLVWCIQENRPWNVMFQDMLLSDETNEQTRPALEFLKARAESVDDLTNDTSRLFFGVSINCAKCHDHPLVSDWKQDHYFGMSAFFDRTYKTRKNTLAEKHSGTVKFKTTAGQEKQAEFMFLTGASVKEPAVEKTKEQLKAEEEEVKKQQKDEKAPEPPKPEFSPRAQFVQLALAPENQHYFARSIVNRTWARLIGTGLVDPPDQMHSENPASHPELLDWLVRDLIAHNYDLKRLTRGIVLSEVYALSSVWKGEGELPAPGYFAVARPRVLTPRQYGLSLLVASHRPDQLKSDDWTRRRGDLERQSYGLANNLELPGSNYQVSVDEALMFANDLRIQNDYLRDSRERIIGYLKELPTPDEQINAAFEAILSRSPDAGERDIFRSYLAERADRPLQGLQQLVWALLTSPEMRFNY